MGRGFKDHIERKRNRKRVLIEGFASKADQRGDRRGVKDATSCAGRKGHNETVETAQWNYRREPKSSDVT